MSSYEQHWGVHGVAINDYKEQLETALERVPADNRLCRSYIQSALTACNDGLTEKIPDGELIPKKSQDVVEKWIRGLLDNHPEVADFGVRV